MTKQEIRKMYLQKRIQLSESEHKRLSQQLGNQFFSCLDLFHINVIHTFLPIKKNNEPDTWLIIDRLRTEFPSIKISIPKVDDGNLVSYFLDSDCVLQENKWGIQEPVNGNKTDSKEIDLVVVPLLAFDVAGHRVGYGKGYYDRFLKECRKDCLKVGASFFDSSHLLIDIDENDIPLDKCITPSTYFTFTYLL